MSNVFQSIAGELPELERRTGGVRQLMEHAVASRLLCLFLGWDWYEQKIAFRDDPDEWMHNLRGDKSPTGRIVYNNRVNRLGDAIYTLLWTKTKGLDALKKRFLERDIKPCFVEAEIASFFAYNGFAVEIMPETGVRGEDFDMTIQKNEITISVEVTAKEDAPLTIETIINTLKKKRTQVPAHRSAVLYMRIPAEWMRNPHYAYEIFSVAFAEFFRRSQRFNAVVLVWEDTIPALDGALIGMSFHACHNNNARHPVSDLEQLLELRVTPDGRRLIAYSFLDWIKSIETK